MHAEPEPRRVRLPTRADLRSRHHGRPTGRHHHLQLPHHVQVGDALQGQQSYDARAAGQSTEAGVHADVTRRLDVLRVPHHTLLRRLVRTVRAECTSTGSAFFYIVISVAILLLGAYPLQDVAAQMSLRHRCMSAATLLAVAMVPNIYIYICDVFLPYLFWLSSAYFPATIA